MDDTDMTADEIDQAMNENDGCLEPIGEDTKARRSAKIIPELFAVELNGKAFHGERLPGEMLDRLTLHGLAAYLLRHGAEGYDRLLRNEWGAPRQKKAAPRPSIRAAYIAYLFGQNAHPEDVHARAKALTRSDLTKLRGHSGVMSFYNAMKGIKDEDDLLPTVNL